MIFFFLFESTLSRSRRVLGIPPPPLHDFHFKVTLCSNLIRNRKQNKNQKKKTGNNLLDPENIGRICRNIP